MDLPVIVCDTRDGYTRRENTVPTFSLPSSQFDIAARAFAEGAASMTQNKLLQNVSARVSKAAASGVEGHPVEIEMTDIEMTLLKAGIDAGGQHDEGIEEETWDAIQASLASANVFPRRAIR